LIMILCSVCEWDCIVLFKVEMRELDSAVENTSHTVSFLMCVSSCLYVDTPWCKFLFYFILFFSFFLEKLNWYYFSKISIE
jgi:hypothetical protein